MVHERIVISISPDFLKQYGTMPPSFKERIAAMKLLAQMDLALFHAELAAGAFEDKPVAIEGMLQQGVLPTELREQVIAVFRTWKLQPVQQLPTQPQRMYEVH